MQKNPIKKKFTKKYSGSKKQNLELILIFLSKFFIFELAQTSFEKNNVPTKFGLHAVH